LIEALLSEFYRNHIGVIHYLILTNPESRLKDLIRTLLRSYRFQEEYRAVIPNTAIGRNIGVIPHPGTRITNRLIAEGKEKLLSGLGKTIKGFEEYWLYTEGSNAVHSPHIPAGVYKAIEDNDSLFSFVPEELTSHRSLLWDYLVVILEEIDKALDGVETAEEWEDYKGLLDEDLSRDFQYLWADIRNVVKHLKDDTTALNVYRSHKNVFRKLQDLQERFGAAGKNALSSGAAGPSMPALSEGAYGRLWQKNANEARILEDIGESDIRILDALAAVILNEVTADEAFEYLTSPEKGLGRDAELVRTWLRQIGRPRSMAKAEPEPPEVLFELLLKEMPKDIPIGEGVKRIRLW